VSGDRLVVEVEVDSAWTAPEPPKFVAWVLAALEAVPISGEISLRIVDEAESAALNERFRGHDSATNVLAFPADPPPQPEGALRPVGDIVICAPVVIREAREQGKPVEAHWAHMAVHGALHLAGYDHEAAVAARAMEAREKQVLAAFGFSDPYESA
jgi:probable rRNA maturation factor